MNTISSKRKRVTSGRPREHADAPEQLRLFGGQPRTSGRLTLRVRPRYTVPVR